MSDNESWLQPMLPSYDGSKQSLPYAEAEAFRRKIEKKKHLLKFLHLTLEMLKGDFVEFDRVKLVLLGALRKMEENGLCYLKNLDNGKILIYKAFKCRFSIEKWRMCPEKRCPCSEPHFADEDCPHLDLSQEDEDRAIAGNHRVISIKE